MRNLAVAISLCAIALISFNKQAIAAGDGLIVKSSDFDVVKTLDRLGIALERAGIKIFARIPHDKGAKSVDMELTPTQTLIFGNPKLGTPLMQSNPAIGLDLPLKAVAWTDADGVTKIAYTDPAWMAARYNITDKDEVFQRMTGALKKFTDMATIRGKLPQQ
jgi:uncharacterized protein (DUF302 family)